MTRGQGIALTAIVLIGYSFVRKTKALGSLTFYPGKFQSLKFDGATPVISFGLGVQNTSNQSFQLKALAGNLYANKYWIGNVSSFAGTIIQPYTDTVITIKIRLSLIGIVTDVIKAITTKSFTQLLELDSYANIDDLQVPIDITYKVGK